MLSRRSSAFFTACFFFSFVSLLIAPASSAADCQPFSANAMSGSQDGASDGEAIPQSGNNALPLGKGGSEQLIGGCPSGGGGTVPTAPSSVGVAGDFINGNYTVTINPPGNNGAITHSVLQEVKNGSVSGTWTINNNPGKVGTKAFTNKPDGSYVYKGKWCLDSQCSAWRSSVTKVVLHKPGTPSSITTPGATEGSYSFSWGTASGQVTRYEWLEQVNGGSWNSWTNNGTSRTKSFSGKADGTYRYRVRACNASGCGGHKYGNTFTVLNKPSAPSSISGPTAVDIDGTYSISWGTGGGQIDYYQLAKRHKPIGGSFNTWVYTNEGLTNSQAFSNLPNGEHDYAIRTCNGAGCSGWVYISPHVNVLHKPGAPTSISGPTAPDLDGSYTISWAGGSGEIDYYHLARRHKPIGGSFGGWVYTVENLTTSEAITNVADGEHDYAIRTCNDSGCSGWVYIAPHVEVLRKPGMPPSISGPSSDIDGSHTITWDESSGHVSHYYLEEGFFDESGTFSGWTYLNMGLNRTKSYTNRADGQWKYGVKACNDSGCSDYRFIAPLVDVLKIPTSPASLGFTEPTEGSVRAEWGTATESVDYYQVRQKLGNGGYTNWSNTGTTRNKTYTNQSEGTYTYQVEACNGSGCGLTRTGTYALSYPAPSSPSNIVVPDQANSSNYTISWDASTGPVDYYEVSQKKDSGGWTAWNNIGGGTTHQVTVDDAGQWTHKVRACNAVPGADKCSNQTVSASVTVNLPPVWARTTDTSIPNAPLTNTGIPAGNTNVGALQGSAGVSGGSASYNIPIAVVPGRKGMQPNVSLNYSSRGGNGIAGMGWSLSAGSSVSRCSATVATDGFTRAVQFDASTDRLCLDGQRLMVRGGMTYGSSNAVYGTEIDSFTKVVQTGDINSHTSYFTVYFKDGKVSKYGSSSQSRHFLADDSGDGLLNKPMAWLIEETQDTSGNTITYDYVYIGDGEKLLDKIHYTGMNGSDGDRHVEFKYEDRIDSNGVTDYSSSYTAGGLTRQTKRLHKIYTKYQNTVVREYRLLYGDMSESSGRSLLRSAQECAYKAGAGYCLPATTFEWQEAAPQYVLEPLTFFDRQNNNNPVVVGANERFINRAVPHGDGNGDGVKDWPNHYVNAEAEILSTHSEQLASCYKPANSGDIVCLAADFNSDGKTDLFRRYDSGSGYRLQIQYRGSNTWIDTGIKWEDGVNDNPMAFTDLNGDGRLDILFRQWRDSRPLLWAVYHNGNYADPYTGYNGSDTNQVKNNDHQILYVYAWQDYSGGPGNGYRAVESDIQLQGDMNGDGLPDFVTFINQTPEMGTLGMPIPAGILLTSPDAGRSVSFNNRSFTDRLNDPNGEYDASLFHDVNADGLTDWLAVGSLQGHLYAKLNTGTDFTSTWVPLNVQLPMRQGKYGPPTEPMFYRHPVMSKVLTMDYDGDGRTEMLIADAVRASACVTFQGPGNGTKCDDNLYGTIQPSIYDSVSQDLNGSVIDESVRNYKAFYFDEDINGNIVTTEATTQISASASQTMVLDATGDGLMDVVTTFGCRGVCLWNGAASGEPNTVQDTGLQEGVYINRNLGASDGSTRFEATDLMKSVTNAFDVKNEWVYRPLSSDQYNINNGGSGNCYEEDSPGSDCRLYYERDDNYVSPTDYDHFYFASSMYVVAEQKASNGIGGMNSTLYRYAAANYNNKGRGFQGFRSIIVENTVRGTKSRTNFHQIWPLSGRVEKACTWLSADSEQIINCGSAISESSANYATQTAGQSGLDFVVQTSSTEIGRDLGTRSTLTTKTTTNQYDQYGNVDKSTVIHDDYYGVVKTEIDNSYDLSFATSWWLDKLDSSVTTSFALTGRGGIAPDAGTDTNKVVTTQYLWQTNPSADGYRMPTEVKVLGGSKVNTVYNNYGQPTQITTSNAANGADPRAVTTHYTSDGYFADWVDNAKGHRTQFVVDATHGQPTQVTDPNGLVATTSYDAFGRVYDATGPGTPTAFTRYRWCGTGVWCPTDVKYRLEVRQAGAPINYTYFDQFNRTLRTLVRNFANTQYVNTRTVYSAAGDKVFESKPYDPTQDNGYNMGTHYQGYDALGRLTQKTVNQAMDNWITTHYEYLGLTTKVDVGNTLMMERTYNGLGQLMETKDAHSEYTRYAYDGAGNPVVIQDAAGNRIVAKYDNLGRKEYVIDPNMGRKDFVYNSFNELVSETDANGNVIAYTYDDLGRMTYRHVNGLLDGKWYWDQEHIHRGKGLLSYEDNYRAGDGTKLRKYYYYTDSATGRKVPFRTRYRLYEGNASNYSDYLVDTYWDDNYGRPKGMRYPSGLTVAYDYNLMGYQTAIKNAASGYVYQQITEQDSWGNVTGAQLTDGLLTQTAAYYPNTSQMQNIEVSQTNGGELHHVSYGQYDVFGNIKEKVLYVNGVATTKESFDYDLLHRLTRSERDGLVDNTIDSIITYGYDAIGNLTQKSDYATAYTYTGTGNCGGKPNAVCQVAKVGGGTGNITYDANGNMKTVDGKSLNYNAFNKPTSVAKGGVTSTFNYGADLMRYKQVKAGLPGGTETTLYLDKLVEMIEQGGATKIRQYISDAVIVEQEVSNDPLDSYTISYLHKDRLGSILSITDHNGQVVERRGFDPFGKPRKGADWGDLASSILASDYTDRGFTGHEHLDDAQLIHMNGRAYDYNLGRFLSVDPFVQDPGSSQSMNPYSYIMNNPLAGVDPTGYKSICGATSKASGGSCSGGPSGAGHDITDVEGVTGLYQGKDGSLYATTDNGAYKITGVKESKGSSLSTDSIGSLASVNEGGSSEGGALGIVYNPGGEAGKKLRDEQKKKHGSKAHSLTLDDGSEFKYNTIGGKELAPKVDVLLSNIRKSEAGEELLQRLAAQGESLDIVESAGPSGAFKEIDSAGSIILLNLASRQAPGVYFQNSRGEYFQGSTKIENVLAHELYHAGTFTGADFFQPEWAFWHFWTPSEASWVKNAESRALRYTNQIRLQRGQERIRATYMSFGNQHSILDRNADLRDSYDDAMARIE